MNLLFLSDLDAAGEWIATQSHIERMKKSDPSINFYLVALSKNNRPYFLNKNLFEKIHLIRPHKFKRPFKSYREIIWQINEFRSAVNELISMNVIVDEMIATYYLGAVGCLLSSTKTGYYFYFHGIRCNYEILPHNLNHFMIFNKLLEKIAWALSKKVLSPRGDLPQIPESKIIFIPNIIRSEFINSRAYPTRLKDGHIVYSGRLAYGKGITRLIESIESIKSDLRLAVCYVETGSEDEKEILSRWKNFPKIVFYRNLNPHQLIKIYQKSRLAVLPSDFEIAPLFYLESIATGLPILTKMQGEISSWSKELGISGAKFYLTNTSRREIAKKITMFLKEEARLRRIFQASRVKFINKYRKSQGKLNLLAAIDKYEK